MIKSETKIKPKVPLRMCISCRQHIEKSNLIRIVKNKNGEIFIDKTFKAAGRGAYVCRNENCFIKLKKTRGLNRNFKCEVPDEIYQSIKGEINTLD